MKRPPNTPLDSSFADSNFCGSVVGAPNEDEPKNQARDDMTGVEVSDFEDTIPTELMELFK